jgi:hypothetical protein
MPSIKNKWKTSGRTRDLLSSHPGQNGKGSVDRTTDDEAYRNNYADIDWSGNASRDEKLGTGLDTAQSSPGVLPAVPEAQHCQIAECGVRSPQPLFAPVSAPSTRTAPPLKGVRASYLKH